MVEEKTENVEDLLNCEDSQLLEEIWQIVDIKEFRTNAFDLNGWTPW